MLSRGPTPRDVTLAALRALQRTLATKLDGLVPTSGNPAVSLLEQEVGAHRVVLMVCGRQVERTVFAEWPNVFWIAVLAILEDGGHRLARCLRPECCRVFVSIRRQQYCSRGCSQIMRSRRWYAAHRPEAQAAEGGRPIRRRSRRSTHARRSPHARGARDGREQGRGGRRADVVLRPVRQGRSREAARRQGKHQLFLLVHGGVEDHAVQEETRLHRRVSDARSPVDTRVMPGARVSPRVDGDSEAVRGPGGTVTAASSSCGWRITNLSHNPLRYHVL